MNLIGQQFYWIFQTKATVFCYQNCSDLLWEKIVLVIKKNFWNSRLKWSERSEQFVVTECFFNLFLEVSNVLSIRTIKIQIGKKILGFRNMQEKLVKANDCPLLSRNSWFSVLLFFQKQERHPFHDRERITNFLKYHEKYHQSQEKSKKWKVLIG